MDTIKVEGLPFEVSRVGLGTWAIGGWMWGGTDEGESIKTIHAALDKGVNLVDTAPVYAFGRSEEIVGKALQGGRRDKVLISTKVGIEWEEGGGKIVRNSTPQRIAREIEDSLERLRTDHVDVYFVHWPDELVPFQETARVLENIKRQGKARLLGVSNHSPEQMDAFREVADLTFCQPPYNIFERAIEADVKPYCLENKIHLMVYGSICRGLLSGRMSKERTFTGDDLRQVDPKFQEPRFSQYLAAVDKLKALARERCGKELIPFAVRWVLDQGASVALWGGRRPEQMEPLDDISGFTIDAGTMAEVDRIIKESVTDPVGPGFMAPPHREV